MNILIIRVSSIGDVIHTLPAISLLKNHSDNIKISWIVQEKAAALLTKQNFLENVWVLPDKFLKPKNWYKTFKVIKNVRKTKWNAIIDFQGILKSTALILFLKGKKFGFDKKSVRLWLTTLFTNHHVEPVYKNIIQKNLALASFTLQTLFKTTTCPTVQTLQKQLTLRVPPKTQLTGLSWLAQNKISNSVLLSPNTTWESKHWPIEYWKKLLVKLSNNKLNNSIVLLGKDFGECAKQLAEFITKKNLPVAIAPKWSLIETAFLIKQSKLLIAPDTGLLHLSDFLGIKTIGIFGPTQAKTHGPFLINENVKNVIQLRSMNQLSPSDLYEKIETILSTNKTC